MYYKSPAFLKSLVDRQVRINRGGPESKEGRLLAVKDDHLILLTEETDYLIYPSHHVKSISIDCMRHDEQPVKVTIPPYLNVETFREFLDEMLHKYVQIYQGGHDNIQGVVCGISEEHVDLVDDHEWVVVPTCHIQTIRCVTAKATADSPIESNALESMQAATQRVEKEREQQIETQSPGIISYKQPQPEERVSSSQPSRRRAVRRKRRLHSRRTAGKVQIQSKGGRRRVSAPIRRGENRHTNRQTSYAVVSSRACARPQTAWLSPQVRVKVS